MLRSVIARPFAVAAVAAASLAGLAPGASAAPGTAPAAVPGLPGAAPPGGQPVLTVGESGYVASGRAFRYAQAVITVPAQACAPGPAQPRLFVALAAPGRYARAGIICNARAAAPRGAAAARHPVPPGGPGRWSAFIEVSLGESAGPVLRIFPLGDVRPGDGVFASAYFNRPGHSVRCVIALPDGTIVHRTFPVPGPAYIRAQALAEWTNPAALAPVAHTLVAQFLSGGFTTANGKPGTFEGPWALHPWEATGGPASQRMPVARPGYLWTDGTQRVLSSRGNAFGVWLYP